MYFDIRIVSKYIEINFNTKIKNMLIIENVYLTCCTCELHFKYIFGQFNGSG